MVGVGVQQRHPEAIQLLLLEEGPQAQRRRLGQVLVRVAEAAVHLQRYTQRPALLCCRPEQQVAEGIAADPDALAAPAGLAEAAAGLRHGGGCRPAQTPAGSVVGEPPYLSSAS